MPDSNKDIFFELYKNKIITAELSEKMSKMVGFRNIAVHDYQNINMDIVEYIIKNRLPVFEELIKALLKIE